MANCATPGYTRPDLSEEEGDIEEVCKSLSKSRKRHLSPSVFRGDQAVDRLLLQEASASPNLKKSRSTMNMADFQAYMDSTVNKKLESLEKLKGGVDSIQGMLDGIDKTVKGNSAKLEAHDKEIQENRAGIAAIRDELRSVGQLQQQPRRDPPSPPALPVQDDEYFRARRSIRLWPVSGVSKNELWAATGDFLKKKLELQHTLRDDMVEAVSRVEIPSGPGAIDEVCVLFAEAQYRDLVTGAASKLSTFVDPDGKPTAGIRIEVPTRLLPTFRILFKFGQGLRSRHGPGTRRHVKFDDAERTLFLNVKLPGDESWSRVSADVAKRGLRSRALLTDAELEKRLDLNGPHIGLGRPRAASTAGSSGSSNLFPQRWPGRRTESTS